MKKIKQVYVCEKSLEMSISNIARMTLLFILMAGTLNLRAEKYAGEIFKLGAGVRNFALGRTGLTDLDTPAKAYWNPALLENQKNLQTEIMHAEDFNGNLKFDIASVNFKDKGLGLVISRIAIDDVKKTALPNPDSLPSNDNRPYAYKSINNADYLIHIGMSRQINDKFSLGLSPKLVFRNLNEESAYGFGADLGAYYSLNESVRFGARFRDFFFTQMFYENGSTQSVNPGLDLESSFVTKLPVFNKKTVFFVNSEINTEGIDEAATLSFGQFSIDWHAGMEITATDNIRLYSGYDVDSINAGMSLMLKNFNFNYSFEHDSNLDNSHRVSVGVNI